MKTLKVCSGLSDILYHRTTDRKLAKILVSNEFSLTVTASSAEKELAKGNYYLSTARTRYGSYDSGNVIITLDGRKLSNLYKGKAVDYWEGLGSFREHEDRLTSDKPIIKNAIKYIKRIDISVKYLKNNSTLIKIASVCKRNKIPLYLFTDKTLRLGNVKNSLDLLTTIKSLENVRTRDKYSNATPTAAKYINAWLEYIKAMENFLYEKPEQTVFSEWVKTDELKRMHRRYDHDVANSYRADLHNSNDKNPTLVNIIDKLQRTVERRGFSLYTLPTLVIELRDKVREADRIITMKERILKYTNYIKDLKSKVPESTLKSRYGYLHVQDPHSLYYADGDLSDAFKLKDKKLNTMCDTLTHLIKEQDTGLFTLAVSKLREKNYADTVN